MMSGNAWEEFTGLPTEHFNGGPGCDSASSSLRFLLRWSVLKLCRIGFHTCQTKYEIMIVYSCSKHEAWCSKVLLSHLFLLDAWREYRFSSAPPIPKLFGDSLKKVGAIVAINIHMQWAEWLLVESHDAGPQSLVYESRCFIQGITLLTCHFWVHIENGSKSNQGLTIKHVQRETSFYTCTF